MIYHLPNCWSLAQSLPFCVMLRWGDGAGSSPVPLPLKGAARLEDLHLWQMEKIKTTKKGTRSYLYWMASWREGGKVRHVHLGSCKKVDHETALQKARKMKREALGIRP